MTTENQEALAERLGNLTAQQLCELYVKLRDAKQARQRELDEKLAPIKQAMELAEGLFLARMQEQGIDSLATPGGTAYKKTRVSYSVKDSDAFLAWALEENAAHMLDVRAAKSAIDELVAESGFLPPGVHRSAIIGVGFRRSANT